MNKTFDEKNSRKLTENLLKTKDGPLIELSKKEEGKDDDEEEEMKTPLNISNIKKESKDTIKLESNHFIL